MRRESKRVKRVPLVSAALAFILAPLLASVVRPMSFEEATGYADVIVIGTVIAKPELAERDPVLGEVVRRNRVRAEEYLKGEGPAEIVVLSLGGKFVAEASTGPELQFMDYGGLPQLPPEGTDVLLFLRRATGPNAYVIVSATHGVRRIARDPSDHRPRVGLDLREPLSPGEGSGEQQESAQLPASGMRLYHEVVLVDDLKDLVKRVDAKNRGPLRRAEALAVSEQLFDLAQVRPFVVVGAALAAACLTPSSMAYVRGVTDDGVALRWTTMPIEFQQLSCELFLPTRSPGGPRQVASARVAFR